VLEELFALISYIKTYNQTISIYVVYEERGMLSSLPLMSEKWGFTLENISEYLEMEKIFKHQNIFFDNEIYLFELK